MFRTPVNVQLYCVSEITLLKPNKLFLTPLWHSCHGYWSIFLRRSIIPPPEFRFLSIFCFSNISFSGLYDCLLRFFLFLTVLLSSRFNHEPPDGVVAVGLRLDVEQECAVVLGDSEDRVDLSRASDVRWILHETHK